MRRVELLVLALLLLASCSNPPERMDGYVYLRLKTDPSTLDPAAINGVVNGSIAAKLYNGLVRLNERIEVIPDIAQRWEVSGDGMTYRFYLRGDAYFSDGGKVTASDFKWSFEHVLNPKTRSPNTWVFDYVSGAGDYMEGRTAHVEGFRAVGGKIFEIRLKRPFPAFIYILTMPQGYLVSKDNGVTGIPVGTGPYRLTGWSHNNSLTLDVNGRYFGKRPDVKGIVYRIIPEDLTAYTEFELGNLDAVQLSSPKYEMFHSRRHIKILKVEGLNTYYLGLNSSRPPFDNIELRRAVSIAIDRERILKTYYKGGGSLARGPLPERLRRWGVESGIGYNPDKAREIVRRVAPGGIKAVMYLPADNVVVDIAEIIQSYLKYAGIAIEIKQLEWTAFREAVNRGEADIFWLSWWADYPDAENFLYPTFYSGNIGPGGNRARYSNNEVDRLIEEARASVDQNKVDSLLGKVESIILKEVPWLPFWHKFDYVVVSESLTGMDANPVYTMDKGEWLKER